MKKLKAEYPLLMDRINFAPSATLTHHTPSCHCAEEKAPCELTGFHLRNANQSEKPGCMLVITSKISNRISTAIPWRDIVLGTQT